MKKKICPCCHSKMIRIFPYFAVCYDCGAHGQLSKPDEWKPFHKPETIDVISSDLLDKATKEG